MSKAIEYLKEAKFTVAKTMPTIPHAYTLGKDWPSRKMFEEAVMYIREHGVAERFYSKTFIYYYANGFKYWTMGNPLERTRLINRAKA